jgi:hypothetical protein
MWCTQISIHIHVPIPILNNALHFFSFSIWGAGTLKSRKIILFRKCVPISYKIWKFWRIICKYLYNLYLTVNTFEYNPAYKRKRKKKWKKLKNNTKKVFIFTCIYTYIYIYSQIYVYMYTYLYKNRFICINIPLIS